MYVIMQSFRGNEDPVNCLTTSEIIYSELQRIFMKSKGKEDCNKLLKLVVCFVTVVSPVSEKSLSIQITDDNDPFMLYTLVINEVDFQSIKEQQGLLIEYDKFPQQLIKLLHLCNSVGGNYHIIIEEATGDAFGSRQTLMKIIETNQFKQLCHLSLLFSIGNDAEIKKHLAVQLKSVKDTLSHAESKVSQAETRAEDLAKKLELKDRELEELKDRWHDETKNIHQQTREEINSERERLLKAQQDLRKSFDAEKVQFQEMLAENKRSFESLLAGLQTENKALFEQSCESDSKLREQDTKLDTLYKENVALQREATMLRNQSAKLDTNYHEKETSLNNLKTRYAVLEQELKDKDVLLRQQRELLQVAHEQKSFLEENLAEKDAVLVRRQTSLQKLSEEFLKGNEIIKTLQKDTAMLKSKIRLRTKIILEQEGVLSSKEKERIALLALVEDQRRKIEHLESVEQQLSESLKVETAKVAEKEAILSNNTNLINWLNRRVSELQTASQVQSTSRLPPKGAGMTTSTPHMGLTLGSHRTFEFRPLMEPEVPRSRTPGIAICPQTEKTGAPRNFAAAATLSDPGVLSTSAPCQNPSAESLQAGSSEVTQTRSQPRTKTFNPSSYFPKGYSKLVSLR
ncbi:spindle assembly abnormal protein 6 homolog isoform X3 [Zootermopsis nevadensis]|uniref:Spindle assembly abnormal protein 6-like protein n=1 Tax=Zootermopsis nevadensis TaxID=136037 RepID=A0A067R6Y8_ZOONE|nr:spindle assembly abnormal protein 6 homolog isoform X3 [Zootermopsis nevadensis]XP_021920598.1 spindle assembly abnormal protein 6 homolog isoform X3 [Zootermopsis nevadensis]XP_021920599.1 spindle assembly abnormal protein 6 homolog isoform X3 [Zootermopsis nevadensis]KDR19091.1 Spindle assembly abnormal protein 6-like protein [Zootermopsis nevadensis]